MTQEEQLKIAIIPARLGSKRIPKKNIREFCGRPILARTIETLIRSEIFSEVVVSTESEEIAEIAIESGALVPFLRSQKLASDDALTVPVIQDAVQRMKLQSIDLACCVYPASPFLTRDLLLQSLEKFLSADDALFGYPVVEYPYPIQRRMQIDSDGITNLSDTTYENFRSQELDKYLHDASMFYWASVATWQSGVPLTRNGATISISRWMQQDINTEEDWEYAEKLFKLNGK